MLLADDNADMREYLQRLLRPGYEVATVTDGQAALLAARANPPDILISDVMMPRLGGLQLVAALRGDLRTADVPVLLLSARAGQEAAIEGLEAGADDYLVKPFSAAELLARVRANVELARVRSHHARWRAALLDSLYEAFFLCDETGAIVEVNAAFADLLGFGPEGLPYPPTWPWWPAENTDPEAHRLVREAFGQLMTDGKGSFTVPFTRRDGRRIRVAGSFNEVSDPDNGRRMVVGTFRDVTAEHYAVQREAALAAMGLVLSRAGSAVQVLHETLGELRRLWRARNVTAATWTGTDQVTVASTGSARTWEALPAQLRDALAALRDQPVLTPTAGEPGGAGIRLEHPAGTLAIWIELDPAACSPPRTGPCSAWYAAFSARRCTGPTKSISNARRRSRCNARSSARPGCPRGSPSVTNPPPARSRSAATGTTSSLAAQLRHRLEDSPGCPRRGRRSVRQRDRARPSSLARPASPPAGGLDRESAAHDHYGHRPLADLAAR